MLLPEPVAEPFVLVINLVGILLGRVRIALQQEREYRSVSPVMRARVNRKETDTDSTLLNR